MLFMPWRDENVDLLCGYNTYEESYTENQQLIVPLHKQYENFNDVIEESKETQDVPNMMMTKMILMTVT